MNIFIITTIFFIFSANASEGTRSRSESLLKKDTTKSLYGGLQKVLQQDNPLEIEQFFNQGYYQELSGSEKADLFVREISSANEKILPLLFSQLQKVLHNFNTPDEHGYAALHYASSKKNTALFKQLLQEKTCDLFLAAQCDNTTPLIHAILTKNILFVEKIIGMAAWRKVPFTFINKADYLGNTPLHVAAQLGQLDIIKLLITRVAAPLDTKNIAGMTALGEAKNSSSVCAAAIAKLLTAAHEENSKKAFNADLWSGVTRNPLYEENSTTTDQDCHISVEKACLE